MTSLGSWLLFAAGIVVVAVVDVTVGAPTDELASVTCFFNGNRYSEGEHIPIPKDVCLHCECRQGWTGPSETDCARIDCPYWMLGFHPDECPMETQPGKCCPDSPCLRKLAEEESKLEDFSVNEHGP